MPGLKKESHELDGFEALVHSLRDRLGPSSGIDSDDVDAEELQTLMEAYRSNMPEWEKYYFPDSNTLYTRNLVDKGNGKSNLLILVWTPGKESLVHDHASAHCIMKILQGRLTETRYGRPTVELNNAEDCPLKCIGQTTYGENEVTYMSDQLGLHKISNPDKDQYAVSLHLYTPPNAAVYGCNIFDEDTGRSEHVQNCGVYSEYGRRSH